MNLDEILAELYDAANEAGYWRGQRRWTETSKEEVIRAAQEKIKGLRDSDGTDWTSWIDHASVRESNPPTAQKPIPKGELPFDMGPDLRDLRR